MADLRSSHGSTATPLPSWLIWWWRITLPLALYAATDVLVQRTYMTWHLGGVAVGFDLAHRVGGLLIFASAFSMPVWLAVSALTVKRALFSTARLRVMVAAFVTIMMFVPYGPLEYVTFWVAGPGPSEGQQLAAAAGRCHQGLVRLFLDQGVDVNARPEGLGTALHSAASTCGPAVVKTLVDRGATVEDRNSLGYTPLAVAVQWGRRDVVSALIANGANPKAVTDAGESVRALAAERGDDTIVAEVDRALRK